MVYRVPSYNLPKSVWVQISDNTIIRKDLIRRVSEDGTVLRVDGVTEKGDPRLLRMEGLL